MYCCAIRMIGSNGFRPEFYREPLVRPFGITRFEMQKKRDRVKTPIKILKINATENGFVSTENMESGLSGRTTIWRSTAKKKESRGKAVSPCNLSKKSSKLFIGCAIRLNICRSGRAFGFRRQLTFPIK